MGGNTYEKTTNFSKSISLLDLSFITWYGAGYDTPLNTLQNIITFNSEATLLYHCHEILFDRIRRLNFSGSQGISNSLKTRADDDIRNRIQLR